MIPLIAIGAVIAGGVAAMSAASSSSDSARASSDAQAGADAAPTPQSYLVTPVPGQQAQSLRGSVGRYIV